MPYEFIKHQGKEILYINYSECKKKDDMINLLETTTQVILNHKGNLRVLLNFENGIATRDYMNRSKELSAVTAHKILKRAAIGIQGIQKIALNGFNKVAKIPTYPFDSKEQALEYLVQD